MNCKIVLYQKSNATFSFQYSTRIHVLDIYTFSIRKGLRQLNYLALGPLGNKYYKAVQSSLEVRDKLN